jgi:hypothetical protein
LRALVPASKAWYSVPVILDGEPRALTNRANAKTQFFAAPSLERRGAVQAGRDQLAT